MAKTGAAGARALIASLCEQHPQDLELKAFLAVARLGTPDKDEARSQVNDLLAEIPNAALYGAAAQLCLRELDLEGARSLIERGKAIDPDDYLLLHATSSLAFAEKDFTAAKAHLENADSLYPCDPSIRNGLLQILRRQDKTEEIEISLDESPDWFKGTGQYHFWRGQSAFYRGDLPEAKRELEAGTRAVPDSAGLWAWLGNTQVRLSEFEEAERSAARSISIDAKSARAYRVLESAAKARGDAIAEADFHRRAVDSVKVYTNQKDLFEVQDLLKKGDRAGAVDMLRKKLKEGDMKGASPRRALLGLLVSLNRWPEARATLDDIDALNQTHPAVEIARCQILFEEGGREDALARTRKLAGEAQAYWGLYPGALRVFLKAGATADADALIERLKTDPPGLPAALALCSNVLWNNGRRKEAREIRDLAARLYPEVRSLKRIEGYYAMMDGDNDRAADIFEELPPHERRNMNPRRSLLGQLRRLFGLKSS